VRRVRVTYYPGCTLYTKAKNLGELAKASAKILGIEMKELENWTCCQAAFPLVSDNIMGLVSPSRIIINAEKEGDKLTTLCSFCYNVLKRTNNVLKNDVEKRTKICEFLEEDYKGNIEVLHFLEIIRNDIGFERLKKKVKYNILNSAIKNGADAIALTCPVCYFNLDKKQKEIAQKFGDFKHIPILYFTELLGLALKVDKKLFDFEKHFIDPRPLLIEKGLIENNVVKRKEEV
jgi:heterodisulfide reductase subunit B